MKLKRPGIQHYARRIASGKPFTFSRYGDGEWSAITADGRRRTGSKSHALRIPSMQRAIRRSLRFCPRGPNYIVSLRETCLKASITRWIARNVPDLDWHDCTVLYKASKKGRLYPFVKAIRESPLPKIVVGPTRLRRLNGRVFKLAAFVEVPNRDCWHKRAQIINSVLTVGEPAIITISAGPPAKAFAFQLFKKTHGNSFIIDVGSLWDVYVNKPTRAYQRNMTPKTIRTNLYG